MKFSDYIIEEDSGVFSTSRKNKRSKSGLNENAHDLIFARIDKMVDDAATAALKAELPGWNFTRYTLDRYGEGYLEFYFEENSSKKQTGYLCMNRMEPEEYEERVQDLLKRKTYPQYTKYGKPGELWEKLERVVKLMIKNGPYKLLPGSLKLDVADKQYGMYGQPYTRAVYVAQVKTFVL